MDDIEIETHPWEPFIPPKARILVMGTFPPSPRRWTMEFYYPNRINDFWRVMGVAFYDNPDRFWDASAKRFRLDDIRSFLTERGIALSDTGHKVRRLKGNASDKFLEIVEAVNLERLLELMPECRAVATTGQKAAEVVATLTGTTVPRMGEAVQTTLNGRPLTIYRMPSTSRAYPMKLDAKAEIYARMFRALNLL